MMRSASVLLPWSMWAMMEKFRMWFMGSCALREAACGAVASAEIHITQRCAGAAGAGPKPS
jgi:hypothetical protein